jgi:PKD domain
MTRKVPVILCALALLSPLMAGDALAGSLGGNGGGCGGFGSLGPVVGVGAGCNGGSAATALPSQKATGTASAGPGDTWRPADNDWGYISCPNPVGPNIASALQEYGPNGKPIGDPVVVCPPDGGAGAPAPPPPPPSPAEVWTQVPLPQAALSVNPARVGLTQLASWFWVTGAGAPVTVSVVVGGYSVTTTATPVAYQWSFGDGATATTYLPGGPDDPSVTHTYHFKGTYIVNLSIAYAGTYSYSGPGGTGTAALGQYVQPVVSTPYVVQEVRSVLIPTGANE